MLVLSRLPYGLPASFDNNNNPHVIITADCVCWVEMIIHNNSPVLIDCQAAFLPHVIFCSVLTLFDYTIINFNLVIVDLHVYVHLKTMMIILWGQSSQATYLRKLNLVIHEMNQSTIMKLFMQVKYKASKLVS